MEDARILGGYQVQTNEKISPSENQRMHDVYEQLKDKVEKLEYVEIKNIKENINKINIDLNTNNILTQQSVDTSKKLAETMDTFKETLLEMGQSLKDGNRISSELTESVKNLNEKVNCVETKMDKKFNEFNDKIEDIDDKSKLDILTWIKANWFGCVMGIGALVYTISQVIK